MTARVEFRGSNPDIVITNVTAVTPQANNIEITGTIGGVTQTWVYARADVARVRVY